MSQSNFKQQLKSGVFYTALAKYSGIVIGLGLSAVLSRLLTPGDFGVIAVATVIIVFFNVFSDMGLGSAIVQKRDLSQNDYNSIFSITVLTGIVLAGIFFGSSWIIADIYEDNRLIVICQVLSAQILFGTWNIVPNSLLVHDKMFKFIGIRTLAVQFGLAGIAAGAAFWGFGVYTLLINPVGGALITLILNFVKKPSKFLFHPNFSVIKKIAGYSGYTFGFSLINYFSRNLDTLMIGRVFGMTPLGFYEKSYRLMLMPVQNLTFVITPVLHPLLADYQHNIKQQWEKYSKVLKMLSMIGFPLSAYLFFTANDLILIIYGNQWVPSIPVFQILSLTIGFQIVGSTTGSFYMASNNTKLLFYVGLINTLVNIGGLFIGIYGIRNIEGVAWMWLATTCISLWNLLIWAKLIGIKRFEAYKPYLKGIIPGLICAVALWPVYQFAHLSLVVGLLVKTFIFAAILLPALQLTKTIDFHTWVKKIFNKKVSFSISK